MVRGAELDMSGTGPVFFTTGMPPGNHNVMGAALTLEAAASAPATPPRMRTELMR